MAVSFVAGSATSLGTINAQTMPWPIGHQVDDVCLLFVETANEPVSLSTPSGFVEIPTQVGTGTTTGASSTRLAVYWCRATSTSMPDVTVADAGDHLFVAVMTFRGCRTTGNPYEVATFSTNATSSTTFTWPSVTTTEAGSVVVFAGARMIGATSAVFSSWANATTGAPTERLDLGTTSGNDGGLGIATTDMASAGSSGVTTATVATSSVAALLTVAMTPPTSSVQKPTTDTATGTDSARVSPTSTTEPSTGSDSATVTATANPNDTSAGTDSITSLTVQPTLAEAAGAADSARVIVVAADSSTGTEAAGGNQTPPVTDTATGTDTASSSSLVAATDTATGTDSHSGVTVSAQETVTGTDSAFLSYKDNLASDTASGTDSATVVVQSTDAGQGSEAAASSTTVTSTDTGQGADSVTGVTVKVTDQVAGTDTVVPMNVGIPGGDSGASTDTATVRLPAQDAGAAVDSTRVRPLVADTASAVDSALVFVTQTANADVGAFSESATVIVHATPETSTTEDGAFLFIEGVGLIAARVVRPEAESRLTVATRDPHVYQIRPEVRLRIFGRDDRTVKIAPTFYDPEREYIVERKDDS